MSLPTHRHNPTPEPKSGPVSGNNYQVFTAMSLPTTTTQPSCNHHQRSPILSSIFLCPSSYAQSFQTPFHVAPLPFNTIPQRPSIPSSQFPYPNSTFYIPLAISPNSDDPSIAQLEFTDPKIPVFDFSIFHIEQATHNTIPITGGVKKPHRLRLGTMTSRKTGKYQKCNTLLMHKLSFERLVGEITQDFKPI